jgi:hypothetical protein
MAVVKKVRKGGVSFPSKEDGGEGGKKAARLAANAKALDAATEAPVIIPGQIEFDQSESIDKISKAIVAFRAKCPNVEKDKQGYGYKYATLGNIINKTRDILKANGLAVIQFPIAGHNALGCITTVIHESGQYLRARFLMPVPELTATNVTQNAGAAITYARRYALGAVLGIATDDDTDATYVEDDAPARPRGRIKRRSG